jgi:hypothetical protein
VLFHGVPVRNNGIPKSSELRLGFAHRMIPITRLSHEPPVRERSRLTLPVKGWQCLRRGEVTERTVLLLEIAGHGHPRACPQVAGIARMLELDRRARR